MQLEIAHGGFQFEIGENIAESQRHVSRQEEKQRRTNERNDMKVRRDDEPLIEAEEEQSSSSSRMRSEEKSCPSDMFDLYRIELKFFFSLE